MSVLCFHGRTSLFHAEKTDHRDVLGFDLFRSGSPVMCSSVFRHITAFLSRSNQSKDFGPS